MLLFDQNVLHWHVTQPRRSPESNTSASNIGAQPPIAAGIFGLEDGQRSIGATPGPSSHKDIRVSKKKLLSPTISAHTGLSPGNFARWAGPAGWTSLSNFVDPGSEKEQIREHRPRDRPRHADQNICNLLPQIITNISNAKERPRGMPPIFEIMPSSEVSYYTVWGYSSETQLNKPYKVGSESIIWCAGGFCSTTGMNWVRVSYYKTGATENPALCLLCSSNHRRCCGKSVTREISCRQF